MLDQERSAPRHGTIIEQHWAAGKNGSRVGAVDMTVCRERGVGGEGHSEVERSAELRGRRAARGGLAPPGRGGAMARVGAAHRFGGGLAIGRARTDIQRRIPDQGAGAQHVPHVGMGAPIQVGVGRGLPGVRISYDHRFEASGPTATRLEWLVELRGPLAFLVRRIFARSTDAMSTARSPGCRTGSVALCRPQAVKRATDDATP